MERHDIEALRLKVLANGYTPIRNIDKRTFMMGWPSVRVDEAEIHSWSRKFSRQLATGIRIENGLCVIDFDIDDEDTMAAIAERVIADMPALERALLRWGKGAKEAWFLRCDELFSRLHTRAFIKPGQVADDGTHRVEIFGGASPRQFGAFGPHTYDEKTGEVLVSYEWADGMSPANVYLDELVEVPKAALWAVIDIAEAVLTERGWGIHEKSTRDETWTETVYDLTPDMLFECDDDVTRTLDELREAVKGEHTQLRCSASWLEGPSAKNRSRCLVAKAHSGNVSVWESMDSVSHREKIDEPIDYGPMIDRVAEKMTELKEKRRLKLSGRDEFPVSVNKLKAGYAYCAGQRNSVVPLWSSSLDAGYQMQSFRLLMLPNCMVEKGPKGGEKKINPVDVWMTDEDRITIDGLRMRPDMPRPVFEEGGKKYANVYSPPDHRDAGGSADEGIGFIDRLIPDGEEREWFLDWLSFKMHYPHIPGPAVVMVAHKTFGTGRGTLTELVSRLFGTDYVRQLPFSSFTGKTYQSQYNEWQSEALMVCVNESSETDGASHYQTKVNTYEHLKDIVEVRPSVKEIRRKGERNYWSLSSTTFLIATNHRDALPIPEHDRRFCVLTNGKPQLPSYWKTLNMWMDNPANVAAFYTWLMARGFREYSPFDSPPMFNAKAAMIEEAKSDLDRALELAVLNMPGEIFTLKQLSKYIKLVAEKSDLELPRPFDAVMKKVARHTLTRVGIRDGKNWHPMFNGERYALYAKCDETGETWTDAGIDEIRGEIARNGEPDGSGSNVLAGFFDKNKPK